MCNLDEYADDRRMIMNDDPLATQVVDVRSAKRPTARARGEMDEIFEIIELGKAAAQSLAKGSIPYAEIVRMRVLGKQTS